MVAVGAVLVGVVVEVGGVVPVGGVVVVALVVAGGVVVVEVDSPVVVDWESGSAQSSRASVWRWEMPSRSLARSPALTLAGSAWKSLFGGAQRRFGGAAVAIAFRCRLRYASKSALQRACII